MTDRHAASFIVPASHPALPGHFPGTPVVPGVVVLDLVLKAAESWQQRALQVGGLKQVKFHSPLLPEERADLELEIAAEALRFQVKRGEHLIAQGAYVLTSP